jgi:DNA-binding response OmpR family regulator
VRRLWVDRQAAQVYLGETTPVQLAPLPYRLLLYLYESRGYRTNEEIKEGVWPDEHYTTDDTVRQTIRRVREALEEAGVNPHEYLVNKPGRGYKLQHTA